MRQPSSGSHNSPSRVFRSSNSLRAAIVHPPLHNLCTTDTSGRRRAWPDPQVLLSFLRTQQCRLAAPTSRRHDFAWLGRTREPHANKEAGGRQVADLEPAPCIGFHFAVPAVQAGISSRKTGPHANARRRRAIRLKHRAGDAYVRKHGDLCCAAPMGRHLGFLLFSCWRLPALIRRTWKNRLMLMPPPTLSQLLKLPAGERAGLALVLWESLTDQEREAAGWHGGY